ncbi:MAG: HNH endonuclease [Methanomassiliicoccales archaeon]|nr:HNH endonuclease [Methanomassiliicoccales archaeon]
MKGCHYQDLPCKRSLCLRAYHAWTLSGIEGKPPSTFYCTESMSSKCPHRGWDHGESVTVQREKAELLKECPACGEPHRTIDERMRCILDQSIEKEFASSGTECGGSCESILPPEIPQEMWPYAWKKIRDRVFERDEGKCRSCGRPLEGMPSWFFEVHHVVPRCEGGSDHPRNLVTLCYLCHKKSTAHGGSPEREDPRQLAYGRF